MVPEAAVVWSTELEAAHHPGQRVWFFVVQLPADTANQIVFGDEGQCWALMRPAQFMTLGNVVPSLPERLRLWPGLRLPPPTD